MTWRETYEKWLNSPALSEEEWKELDAIRDDPKGRSRTASMRRSFSAPPDCAALWVSARTA